MRLVVVTHCHPATPHVCATRAREFSCALARRGHRVVLLTESLGERGESTISPPALGAALEGHAWEYPFLLGCPPVPRPLLEAAREGRLSRWLRRPLLAATYFARGGLFLDWRAGSQPYWAPLATDFRPDAVWAIFGNTDALVIGRAIARFSACPWVLDVKDPWSGFIPWPLRRTLARRFCDFAAATGLSEYHTSDLERHFGRTAVVVRSGVAVPATPPPPPPSAPRLLVFGALYDQADLEALLAGVTLWFASLPPERLDAAVLSYAGSEGERFRQAAARAGVGVAVETVGYVSLERLADLARSCSTVLYVRSRRAGYQHKLVELAAFGRPAVCLPAESKEADDLMAHLGGTLASCQTAPEVAAALGRLEACPPSPAQSASLAEYTWDSQAERLIEVLARAGAAK